SELDGQMIGTRIETDDELGSLPLDRFGKAVGEVRGRDGRHFRQRSALRRRWPPCRRPSSVLGGGASVLAALDCCLKLASCRELRDGRRGDRHLLARITRIHALALGAMLRRELPKPREGHFLLATQRVRYRVEKRVDRFRGVARRQTRFRGDLIHELLFRQVPLLLWSDGTAAERG